VNDSQHAQECRRDDLALANDGDPDGDALTIVSVSPTMALPASAIPNVVFTPTE